MVASDSRLSLDAGGFGGSNAEGQQALKLAELKALRESGKKVFDTYQVEDAPSLYEEVDEDGYKKIVRERLDQDDFVVDDNGEGYADDGREEWDRAPQYGSESEDDMTPRGRPSKAAKKQKEDEKAKRDANDRDITQFFTKGATKAQPKVKVAKTKEDDDFLAGLLGEVDTNIPAPAPALESGTDRPLLGGDPIPSDIPMSDPAPSSPTVKVAERKAHIKEEPQSDEDDEEMMEVAHVGSVAATSVNIAGSKPVKKIIKREDYPTPASSSPPVAAQVEAAVDSSSWNELNDRLNVVTSTPTARVVGKMEPSDATAEDGSVNMFWTDYTEINGSLCLFGKVFNKKTKTYVSCFVKVDNILRKLYFLPRKHRLEHGVETDEEVTMGDVFSEVDEMMTNMKVGFHKIKPCTRKYAFELRDIPKEAQYLKVLYPYTKFQFVLWKNIMGPCWLKIDDPDFSALKNASHCKLEIQVDHPNAIAPVSETLNLEPPFTMMSIAMRTTFNAQDNKQEILALSARIYEDISLTETKRNKGLIKTMKQESEMLSFFLAQVDVVDPDIILGHQLEGVDYSILLNRLHEKKTHQWSRLGRLRRSQWPSQIGKVGGNVFAERQVIAGRLLCDLGNDAGKSIMFKCQSWSLTEMCNLYLPGDNRRRDVDNEVALKTWATTKDGLMDYVTHMETDTYFIAALALQIQMLPLTQVLTNLAGNSWARTLTGTRAERNEYILLHEFHRNKYICPDKQTFRGRRMEDENQEDGDNKKKDKYQGGLVFEPEKGLYDKFVLVMDFNSLYPPSSKSSTSASPRWTATNCDAVPAVPQEQDLGILPKLISTLVNRRRQVKSLMKDKTATPEQLATWEIKQLALKLTANSMYGCLGYSKSRFYARPLAILTTYKGREILRSTKELAESQSLQVIYGDTDSVMINANVDNVTDALKVGREFKKLVNNQYKLLEIDIDNIFRRILLQAKKKYAAINLVEKDGKWVEKMEVKGLDMKRREYCALSKDISSRVLNEILSGDETEVAIGRIHEYLREITGKMREKAVPNGKYIIFTQLGKAPADYPNGDSMPQVQVALRDIARGKTVRKGDVMSYIITGDSSSSEPAPKRAYAPPDVMKADSGLSPDVEWYIGKQIFPPVERLCANITGTSTAQLAENLGLDIKRYATNTSAQSSYNDTEIHPLESQIPDRVRFVDCEQLLIRCRACKKSSVFEGLVNSPNLVTPKGIICGDCKAATPSSPSSRRWSTRSVSTPRVSVAGSRCLVRSCDGKMRYEYGEKAIYNQLLLRDEVLVRAEQNRKRFATVKGVVDRYLEKCGRQWVAMDRLFAKLGPITVAVPVKVEVAV
ncbi:unnamed protein product [Parascedosporium putredinis]|uniref:DNA polymerase n=1 Tax=Parascedosporium putredinis TaxID=1442378 RepID=A0A9P1GXR1_9PEZI|nr:unnamed protein product [Parascedosporium putredinis]CAI7989271.1 unnamed protein product [Parascedosporium putredinis]